MLGYDFLLHIFSLYIYLPSYENPKTLRYTLNYCLQCYYKYFRTLLIITEYLKPERSHRTTETVTSLSFNSLSKSGKYLVWNVFPTRSRGHPIPSPRPRASVARNKLLWVAYTHKESYKVLGTFGNPCESPEGLSDDSQASLVFFLFP
jgi:hypothetical protein